MVAAIEHPWIDAIGHPTGRKIAKREPYKVDVDALIEAAARTGTMLEINGAPDRRDLNDVHARAAAEAGVSILIDSDAHGAERLEHVKWAVATARRAWLGPEQIANTRPWKEFAGAAQAGEGCRVGAELARPQQPRQQLPRHHLVDRGDRERRQRRRRLLRVAGARRVQRRPQRAREILADQPRIQLPGDRQRRVRPRRRRRDEQASVRQRLELREPVVLPPRRRHEDPRAPQQRPVRRRLSRPATRTPAASTGASVPATTSSSPSRRAADQAARTRSSPFFQGSAA